MAGLKKPPKRRDNTNPNTALVVFLVLFVLLSIGLGIGLYYGYAGQDQLKKAAEESKKAQDAMKALSEYHAFIQREVRLALGGKELDAAELEAYTNGMEKFYKEGGPYKDEPTREAILKTIDEIRKDLGYDQQNGKFRTNYKEKVAKLTAEAARAKTDAAAAIKAREDADKRFATINAKLDLFYKDALGRIQTGNATALAEAKKQATLTEQHSINNEKLRDAMRKLTDDFEEERQKMTLEKNKLIQAMQLMAKDRKDAAVANPRGGSQQHALLLDISRGRPLWDAPLGKITRVELQDRKVIINLGAADGVRPELTFNVFAPANGRADGGLKGTIEVIRVLDNNTSVARITSLYDGEGREILINDLGRNRIQREADNPIREGDLLFNVFWGTHVAIAGRVNWAEYDSNNPAEQMRGLNQFRQLLERQGVVIDAYLDLTDGTVKGAMTARTRFLIYGDGLGGATANAGGGEAPAEKAPMDKEKEGAEKEKAEKAEAKAAAEEKQEKGDGAKGVGLERVQLVNEARRAMKSEALERGMFLISPENYANVVGYRPPQSANRPVASDFRPSLPSASNIGAAIVPGGNPAPAPVPEGNEK